MPQETTTLLQGCFDKLLDDGLRIVLMQSAQYHHIDISEFPVFYPLIGPVDDEDYELELRYHPHYQFNKENIERSVHRFIDQQLPYCTSRAIVQYPDLRVTGHDISINVGNTVVTSSISLEGTVGEDDITYSFEPIGSRINTDMNSKLTVVQAILAESVEGNTIPFDLILDLERQYNFHYELDVYTAGSGSGELIRSRLQFSDYFVYFGAQFDWSVGEHS